MTPPLLTCVTWNVHRARGADGRIDPARITDAIEHDIAPLRPDILSLQEADEDCPPHAGLLDIAGIEAASGTRSAHLTQRLRWGLQSDGFLGTILFLHPSLDLVSSDVIDLPGHCYRGAVVAHIRVKDHALRVIATHLSLAQPLRAVQMRILGQYAARMEACENKRTQTLLLGDLNEWRYWGGLAFSAPLFGRKLYGAARATFPARWPLLPLDRILSDRPDSVEDLHALQSPRLRVASDHLPLTARIRLPS